MLERAAQCLETGNLRRIIPGSKNVMKSRRMLHSSFWNHGATELELSSLWSTMVLRPGVLFEQDEDRTRVLGVLGGPLLDFLYPSGAMKIIKQFQSWGPDTQEHRRTRTGLSRVCQRLYTSSSDSNRIATSEGSQDTILQDRQIELDSVPTHDSITRKLFKPEILLEEIIGGKNPNRCEEAWRLYQLIDNTSRLDREFTTRLLIYLSASKRSRNTRLMNILSTHFGSAVASEKDCVTIIRRLLQQKRYASAVLVYDYILTTYSVPFGSDILLAHFLSTRQFKMASSIWTKYRQSCDKNGKKANTGLKTPDSVLQSLHIDPWGIVSTMPDLADIASKVAHFADDFALKESVNLHDNTTLFAGKVVHYALMKLAVSVDVDEKEFNDLLHWLRKLNTDLPEQYESLLSALFEFGHTRLAVTCYRQYRDSSTNMISYHVLNEVTKTFCKEYNVVGMKQVLDDWFLYHKGAAPVVYRRIMPMFASLGDVDTVTALWDQYAKAMARNGRIIGNALDFGPLLHVHAVRGEVSKVEEGFKKMQEEFGVKPDVMSWNILISAHAKIRDVDGAQDAFERLVSSHLHPDDYTYGTLMGMCTAHGDGEKVMELYQLAISTGVMPTCAMIDCVVLSHLQDDHLAEGEELCVSALKMKLEGSRTRMWTYLVNAYGMRRDLKGVHRILGLMNDAGVEWDETTYSALMQALAMKRQPYRAYTILKKMMPKAGVPVRPYHYALVMGGFIATREFDRVPQVYRHMLDQGGIATSSIRLMALKAAAITDQEDLDKAGSQEAYLAQAEKYFLEAIASSTSGQEVSDTLRKGQSGFPLDIAAHSSYFAFLIFVYGQQHAFNRVEQLYAQYLELLPEERRGEPPIEISTALMVANVKKQNYDGVQHLWDLTFRLAVEQSRRVPSNLAPKDNGFESETRIESPIPKQRWKLTKALSAQMRSLALQDKFEAIKDTIKAVERAGFMVNSNNWNLYAQLLLTRTRGYKRAFELCETKLMDRWTGWQALRWRAPVRNRLSMELRAERQRPDHTRPGYGTLMLLAKAYMNLRDAAVELPNAQIVLDGIRRDCPKTVRAVETMVRNDSPQERAALGSGIGATLEG